MILDCGHEPSKCADITNGYGITSDGKKHCYDCVAKIDRDSMTETGRATLYLTQENSGLRPPSGSHGHAQVCNWPGSLSYRAYVKRGRHNIAGVRYDVWFRDHENRQWHGVQYGDNTQICHCKRIKG